MQKKKLGNVSDKAIKEQWRSGPKEDKPLIPGHGRGVGIILKLKI